MIMHFDSTARTLYRQKHVRVKPISIIPAHESGSEYVSISSEIHIVGALES